MTEVRLTERRIQQLKAPVDKVYERIWDTEVIGLCVKVSRSGTKRYLFKYLVPETSAPAWYTGPNCSDYSIEDMRDDVRAWKVQLKKGVNPFARAERTPTVNELCQENLQAKKENGRKPLSEAHLRDMALYVAYVARSRLGAMKVKDVSIAEASQFLGKYRQRPRLHDRMRWWLMNCFDLAIKRGYLPLQGNPWQYVDKEYSLPDSEDLPRFSDEEIGQLAAFLRKAAAGETKYYYGPVWIGFMWFLIRNGTRPNDTRIIERAWIDEVKGQAVIRHPRTKTGKKIIYLSQESVEDLETIEGREGNPFLFPGKQAYLKNYATSFTLMRQETGLTKPPYAIRRWFASTGRRVFKGEIKPVQDLVGWETEEMALRYAGDDESLIENVIMENAEVCRKVASRINEVLHA